MNFKVQLPQNAGNRISEVLDFKISRGRIPPDPPTSARFSASVNKTTGSAPAEDGGFNYARYARLLIDKVLGVEENEVGLLERNDLRRRT